MSHWPSAGSHIFCSGPASDRDPPTSVSLVTGAHQHAGFIWGLTKFLPRLALIHDPLDLASE
jgi:hypothetical protein